jgi:hypothetical protein
LIPWNLINRRAEKRHLKAIDVETGELVGYARWLLPPILADKNVWPEAAVAEPAQRSVNSLKRMIEPRKSMTQCLKKKTDGVVEFRSKPLKDAEARIMKSGPYIG